MANQELTAHKERVAADEKEEQRVLAKMRKDSKAFDAEASGDTKEPAGSTSDSGGTEGTGKTGPK